MTSKPVIGVIVYSTYGHVATLAEEVIKGAEAAGAIVKPFSIQETLSEEILSKMHAGASLKPKYPIITPNDLKELDGFLLGAPTRYGRLPAQVSAFFDQTGGLWATGGLVGKFASTFTSTASQHGGHETTHLTTLPFFVHHGIIYVPIGYTQPYLTDLSEAHGASPYGTSTLAGADGSRQPLAGELQSARYQGEYFAKVVGQSVRGRQLLASEGGGAGTAAAADSKVAAKTAPEPSVVDEKKGYDVDGTGAGAGTGAAAGGAAAAGAAAAGGAAAAAHAGDKNKTGADTATGATGTTGTGTAAGTGTGTGAAGGAGTTATPAADTDATAAGTTGAGAKPAQPKKKGGLFSCCSGGSIE